MVAHTISMRWPQYCLVIALCVLSSFKISKSSLEFVYPLVLSLFFSEKVKKNGKNRLSTHDRPCTTDLFSVYLFVFELEIKMDWKIKCRKHILSHLLSVFRDFLSLSFFFLLSIFIQLLCVAN